MKGDVFKPINKMRMGNRVRGQALELRHRVMARARISRSGPAEPVIVYQMGKVGSSTVVSTLESLNLGRPVYHVHTLSPAYLPVAIKKQRASISPHLPEHLVASQVLTPLLGSRIPFCDVVTLTREPIARAISFVLEDRKKQAPGAIGSDGSLDVNVLEQAVIDILSSENGNADPTDWFDRELKSVFSVDVFARPHDFERGFGLFESPRGRALVIRMEDLDERLPVALASFLGVDRGSVRLQKSNVGSQKRYASELSLLKQRLRLPAPVLERVTNTKYFRHFYHDMREQVIARWS